MLKCLNRSPCCVSLGTILLPCPCLIGHYISYIAEHLWIHIFTINWLFYCFIFAALRTLIIFFNYDYLLVYVILKKNLNFVLLLFCIYCPIFLISKRVKKRLSLVSTPLNCIHPQENFCSSIRLVRYQAEKKMIFWNHTKKCFVTRNKK